MGKIICTIGLVLAATIAKSQDEQKLLLSGNQLYKKQQFDKAAGQYQKAADLNALNAKTLYNLGNALYKGKKTEDAEKAYGSAVDNAKNVSVKSKALYNKGVTLSRQNKLPESVQAYKETLRLNPADEEARQNLQKALNDLKKQPPPPKPQENKQNKNQNQNKKQPEPQQNKSKLNQKQVEQMLNALRQDEKKLQQNLQKRNNTGGANSKDW